MEWNTVKLGDIVRRKIGYGIVQPGESRPCGVPVIKVNNIIAGLTSVDDLEKTTEEIECKYQRTRLQGGELIISLVGSVGNTAIVPKSFKGCNLVRATGLIDIEDPFLTKWVKYYIDSPLGQYYIKSNLNTTVQATLNVKSLVDMPIPMPDSRIIGQIVAVLSSLDDKIENNNRINANLEAQAQALFKSWFVDFEPWGGTMPEDWREGVLSDIADITMGQSPRGESYNTQGEGVIFYQGCSDFGDRFPSVRMFTTEPARYAVPNSILMSVRAPVGTMNVALEECCIGRGLASLKEKNSYDSFLLYLLESLQNVFDSYNGDGTVFGSINKKSIGNIKIVIPSIKVVESFHKMVSPLDEKIKFNHQESARLAALRDTLLPKLMKGEIKV